MNSFFARQPAPEWKSDWRKNIERIVAEDRAAPRANRPARCAQPKPQRERKPRQPREVKPKAEVRRCSCGRVLLRAWDLCSYCRSHPREAGRAPVCQHPSGCTAKLNQNNATGLCKKHGLLISRRKREERLRGPRPVCKYQADGMRCTQKLYRDNPLGVCGFHSGRQMGSEYRKRKPQMEAING